MKWTWNRGRLASQSRISLVLCSVVVEDQMNVELLRHVAFDGVEEGAKLGRAMAALGLADHVAGLRVERREQARGAVPLVVVSAALHLAGTHRQQRCGAIKRLDLTLLVHAQPQGAVGRVQVEAYDVSYLVDKERIAGELEGLGPVRFERKGSPDAADRRLTQSCGRGHLAR